MKSRSKEKRKRKRKMRQAEVEAAVSHHEKIMQSMIELKLTDEDMGRLEEEVKPAEGGPWELGWPHIRVLLNVEEPAERFWYEEKARNQGLTLRELERAVCENVFYKTIGREPPKPRPLGRKMPEPEIRDEEFDHDPGYQKLVKDIRKVIDRAEAKGVAMRHRRDDILSCVRCDAFEDVFCGEEQRRTFLGSGKETKEPFLVIDKKETHEYRKHGHRFITDYQYVCGVCGAHQSTSLNQVHYEDEV